MRIKLLLMGRETIPIHELIAWCKAQRRHATEGTPRYATYTLLIETLEHLSHVRDVMGVPAEKFERLCAKARATCGWVQHRVPPPDPDLPVPPDHRQCLRCRQVKPNTQFQRRATDKERAAYGWNNKVSVRWVTNAYCKQCRTNRIKRERRRAKTALLKTEAHTSLQLKLADKIAHTKQKLRTGTSVPDFYRLRLACLKTARGALETHINTGTPCDEALVDWTLLLPSQDRAQLFDAYQEVLEQHLPGRTPTI